MRDMAPIGACASHGAGGMGVALVLLLLSTLTFMYLIYAVKKSQTGPRGERTPFGRYFNKRIQTNYLRLAWDFAWLFTRMPPCPSRHQHFHLPTMCPPCCPHLNELGSGIGKVGEGGRFLNTQLAISRARAPRRPGMYSNHPWNHLLCHLSGLRLKPLRKSFVTIRGAPVELHTTGSTMWNEVGAARGLLRQGQIRLAALVL